MVNQSNYLVNKYKSPTLKDIKNFMATRSTDDVSVHSVQRSISLKLSESDIATALDATTSLAKPIINLEFIDNEPEKEPFKSPTS